MPRLAGILLLTVALWAAALGYGDKVPHRWRGLCRCKGRPFADDGKPWGLFVRQGGSVKAEESTVLSTRTKGQWCTRFRFW